MTLPDDSLIQQAVTKLNARLTARSTEEQNSFVRGGLLFTGNIHDSMPRRLILDQRLSPLDKMGWIIIRLHALSNDGAVFPSYEELQLQLATPGKGKASKETVSRILLMLRITGWLSLCKRVRDEKGRVRGNIYAQHDEPLTFADAETFDPHWLKTVAEACLSNNRTISTTAKTIISEIRLDPTMNHHRSHLQMIEARLGSVLSPDDLTRRASFAQVENSPGSDSELNLKVQAQKPDSDAEHSDSARDNGRVRNPNSYVRSFTNNTDKTYVTGSVFLPKEFALLLKPDDRDMVNRQLQALSPEQSVLVLSNVARAQREGSLQNPLGWLLTVLKKARRGELYPSESLRGSSEQAHFISRPELRPFQPSKPQQRQSCSEERVREIIQNLRSHVGSRKK
ncbi:STY4528 family pathogenicity island replication protein [Pantoea anthophila]|uniref:Helix-turn-helix domain-containing protein n=1 Tax=Pantoea anthophila TaxID=470931 RepID=A0ABY2Z4V7_9GAMM|nr:STY4528 family pathogenicity island replication protein [Pantoea anthophila]TPV23689.1 helix-turn-helix domain-containing protein [Pantoea anthophila]